MRYSPGEMMVITAARSLRNGERVLVGVGKPNLAANLAKRMHAPDLEMVYEAGVIGSNPNRLPLSIGDPCLVVGANSVCSSFDLFSFYLQGGLIDVGFLEAAQVDRFGNLNTTVIGSYQHPSVRLPGSGGACEIAIHAKRIVIIVNHRLRCFPEQVDFITSPGYITGRRQREELGLSGGPQFVITDLCMMDFDETGEMEVFSLHPGVTIEEVKKNTGWEIKVAPRLVVTEEPTDEELRILRQELDPKRIYLKD